MRDSIEAETTHIGPEKRESSRGELPPSSGPRMTSCLQEGELQTQTVDLSVYSHFLQTSVLSHLQPAVALVLELASKDDTGRRLTSQVQAPGK